MIGRSGAFALAAALAFAHAALWPRASCHAQAVADSSSADSTRTAQPAGAGSRDRDRWEFGVAAPEGYFDLLGTLAYRRLVRVRERFEQSLKVEITGGHLDYLSEGSASLYYLVRPTRSYRPTWKLRPLVEVGPGFHVVFEAANIEGFNEYSYHTQAYLKLHLYLGAEWLLGRKFGLLVTGRFSVPEHHPIDYAQAAILLR